MEAHPCGGVSDDTARADATARRYTRISPGPYGKALRKAYRFARPRKRLLRTGKNALHTRA